MIDRLRPTERLLFASDTVCAGTFACASADPHFHQESPSTAHCIVFSRTPVWIRHEQGVRYVADPTVVTFHNRGRAYRRWKIADVGDRCDWLAFADDVVVDVISHVRRRAARDPLWFPTEFTRVVPAVYARQRRLFECLHQGSPDGCAIEEQALALLDDVTSTPTASGENEPRWRHREFAAVQHARSLIAANPARPLPLRTLARAADLTVFQLCRAFRRVAGETMTSYRLRLRLLSSLEDVRRGVGLTEVALSHGFCSHSHFTAAFRSAFGVTPSEWRNAGA